MKPRRVLVVLVATALVGCSAQTHDAAPARTAGWLTTIAAVPAAATMPQVSATPTPTRTVSPKPVAKAKGKSKSKATHKPPAKPTGWACVLNQPCKLPPLTSSVWKVTHGCTSAWRASMHTDTCPPGQPRLP